MPYRLTASSMLSLTAKPSFTYLLRVVRDRGVVLQVVLRPGCLGLRVEVDLLLLFFEHGRVHSAGGDGTLYAQRCGFFSSAFHSQTRAGPSHAVVPYVSATSTAFGCLVENLSHAAIILTPRFLAAGKPSTAFAGFLVPPRCGGSLGFGFMRSYEP